MKNVSSHLKEGQTSSLRINMNDGKGLSLKVDSAGKISATVNEGGRANFLGGKVLDERTISSTLGRYFESHGGVNYYQVRVDPTNLLKDQISGRSAFGSVVNSVGKTIFKEVMKPVYRDIGRVKTMINVARFVLDPVGTVQSLAETTEKIYTNPTDAVMDKIDKFGIRDLISSLKEDHPDVRIDTFDDDDPNFDPRDNKQDNDPSFEPDDYHHSDQAADYMNQSDSGFQSF